MGNRANFGFRQNEQVLFLWGHWAGEKMFSRLANALDKARPYWQDENVAMRIATSEIVADASTRGEDTWALSINEILDNEHKIPVVDFSAGTVALYEEDPDPRYAGAKVFSVDLDTFVKRYKK
jgi:hypothetical protein